MMAERPLDRLLPQALALILGLGVLAAALAAVVTDVMMGRPSTSSALGIVFMLPLALLAAVVGFAAGHMIGTWLRGRGMTPDVPMGPYRIVMAFVLAVATVIGATFGARPVFRHERLQEPRVMMGAGAMQREPGRPQACETLTPAVLACDLSSGASAGTMVWNGRDVTVGCTREGRITVSDASAGVVASADLSAFEYVRHVRAAAVMQTEGREGLALLAGLRATGRRHMFLIFDADGRVIYQELLRRDRDPDAQSPLSTCATDDASMIVVDLGEPVTYRGK
ncbi:MAG: hypothetical protein WD690_12030 [Vicinamibacterales bacterium]